MRLPYHRSTPRVSERRTPSSRSTPVAAALAVAATAFLLLVPAGRGESGAVVWAPPTPADHTEFATGVGSGVRFVLTASTSVPDAAVRVEPDRLPEGATFSSTGGTTARAVFAWRPSLPGLYTIRFAASATGLTAPKLTYTIRVQPRAVRVTDDEVAGWALVLRRTIARAQPTRASKAVATLETTTSDDTQNNVLILDRYDVTASQTWYRVRLPILPNNSTGWVPAANLGHLYTIHTHLYVDRAKLTATLERDGKPIFRTRVGVGKTYWPTPRGEFYVRSKLTNFNDPFYGPLAFGTSARSQVLTDWPGGGFVGLHGTSLPELLPGRVSHGCIRFRNDAILKLASLMSVGTPLTIL